MKLHDVALSGNCYKVRLFLGLIGHKAELVQVDLQGGAHKRPAFLTINPRGQVPALEDGELRLGDSHAILAYLARQYGEPHWHPQDAMTQGRIANWLSFSANEVQHGLAQARVIQLFKRPGDLATAQAKGRHALELLDATLADHRWLAQTERPSIADIAVYPYVALAPEGGLEPSGYPYVQDWLARVRALPGYVAQPAL
ncbi:glutathione S-transferase family protein [Pseudomonas nitroreducens]|uniref:Glutathione S-transferase family protein n=1 Tax=Pseudomonas nitroreducens TaxID=46680 RepID=A0A6G6J0A8_PSENT|nr:glutathione S-transferase family protein [Pseudomonas nitroreducens]MBG6285901.1 glutathione S-transferase family protein [Pseudomonas nitroreducens]MCJ1881361.1 glutathione S-transferase family protein [Pseudomonas nitroreducens]MCJ1893536.1 glutathione S-transferase family protein [Pseudomonas nitroreducens]MDG9857275.1 glutathione S-transferase family protein [Pseudomonas nitroreducens]MDH1075087.1 glutathione S-transferase family protein [Pseudomonas nitroreducens]